MSSVTMRIMVLPGNPIPPTLNEGLSTRPSSIAVGGVSTLTITLSNANLAPATLTAPLTDTLPPGLVIATPPNASTTCGVGVVTAPCGRKHGDLDGRGDPGQHGMTAGTCTVKVDVTAPVCGQLH